MEKTNNTNTQPAAIDAADQLLLDQQELDMLAVEISLGKADVKDKFEEAKKQMKISIHNFKQALSLEHLQTKDWAIAIKDKLSDLGNKLTHGKAETKQVFEEQKNNILKGIDNVKNDISKNPQATALANYFTAATEKIKLQLELFEKKMGVEKKELTQGFKDEMHTAREKISLLVAKAKAKKENFDSKLDNFNEEIHVAYDHLKKAIRAL